MRIERPAWGRVAIEESELRIEPGRAAQHSRPAGVALIQVCLYSTPNIKHPNLISSAVFLRCEPDLVGLRLISKWHSTDAPIATGKTGGCREVVDRPCRISQCHIANDRLRENYIERTCITLRS
jgi:hypothetical protein